ncbi:MAG: HAD family hydrolase [Muribaculaceae bacterium]|nr:HAD family hydrolase [Muribaculaceae bacterium]
MSQHAALFDLDGVLIDSEGVYFDFWDNIEKKYPTGIPNFASAIKGSTLNKIMDYYPDPEVRKSVVELLKEQERSMRYVIFDGVLPFLDELKRRKVPCAIVTSSNEEKMNKLFAQHPEFEAYFEVVITDRQVTKSKPDPQGYLLAAEKLGCQPCDCYVFEDSLLGLEAGRRSGAKVVGLATTNSADKISAMADKVISSFKQLSVDQLLKG